MPAVRTPSDRCTGRPDPTTVEECRAELAAETAIAKAFGDYGPMNAACHGRIDYLLRKLDELRGQG